MLNPALVAVIVAEASRGHLKESGDDIPWMLSFVVAPMVLHRGTRESLPTSTRTHFATWASDNPVLRAGFPQRAIGLVEHVREGIRFGLARDVFHLVGDRIVAPAHRKPRGFEIPAELGEIIRKANLAGRWMAKSDSPSAIFAILGVAP
ncbi:three component ABC system middle component [Catenulispora subtropica]|uniref:Uncharacterized protein n=1 Tax=Catenulispora subtropica TaxID=450798 RepID=A0ABN2R459_9ACTN